MKLIVVLLCLWMPIVCDGNIKIGYAQLNSMATEISDFVKQKICLDVMNPQLAFSRATGVNISFLTRLSRLRRLKRVERAAVPCTAKASWTLSTNPK